MNWKTQVCKIDTQFYCDFVLFIYKFLINDSSVFTI